MFYWIIGKLLSNINCCLINTFKEIFIMSAWITASDTLADLFLIRFIFYLFNILVSIAKQNHKNYCYPNIVYHQHNLNCFDLLKMCHFNILKCQWNYPNIILLSIFWTRLPRWSQVGKETIASDQKLVLSQGRRTLSDDALLNHLLFVWVFFWTQNSFLERKQNRCEKEN